MTGNKIPFGIVVFLIAVVTCASYHGIATASTSTVKCKEQCCLLSPACLIVTGQATGDKYTAVGCHNDGQTQSVDIVQNDPRSECVSEGAEQTDECIKNKNSSKCAEVKLHSAINCTPASFYFTITSSTQHCSANGGDLCP